MKKAKIMLTAIAVFAVVGGALAFKAKHRGTIIYCSTSSSTGSDCAQINDKTYTAGSVDGVDLSYCTNANPGTSGACATRSHLSTQQ